MHEDKEININRLSMDQSNPRHQKFESQREIIEWMTSGKGNIGDKLYVLAEDISKHGISPLESICVTPSPANESEYTVLEGNRRITALKLLNDPAISPTPQWKSKFQKLSQDYKKVTKIKCIVFDDEIEAYHFIELKHMGEAKGAGTVPWDPEQKTRHDQRMDRKGKYSRALEILEFIRSSDQFSADVKAAAELIPITTLDRLLTDRNFREFLGLEMSENGEIQVALEREEVAKPLRKVILDFGTPNRKNVRDVINRELREKYMQEFGADDIPDVRKKLAAPIPATVQSASVTQNLGNTTSQNQPKFSNPTSRRFIVISGTNIPIDPKKYNRAKRIFEELKRIPVRTKDSVPEYPNAGILLLRLFLEMSTDFYIDVHQIKHQSPNGWKDISLAERVKSVLENLVSKCLLNPQETKVITKALGDPKKIANPNSLNDFAHNKNQVVNPADLIDVWDTYLLFLTSIWGEITKNG